MRPDMHMGRPRGRIPESHPRGDLNYFYGGISSGFPLTNHFDLPGSQSVFGIVHYPPKSRWILPQRHLGRTSLDLTPLWPPRGLFCTRVVGEVP